MPPDRRFRSLFVRPHLRGRRRCAALATVLLIAGGAFARAQDPSQYPGTPAYPGQGPVQAIPLGPQPSSPTPSPGASLGQPQSLPPQLPPTPGGANAPGGAVAEGPELSEEDLIESAEVVARVGRETILAGDLLGMVNQQIEAVEKTVPPEQLAAFRKEVPKHRRLLIQRLTEMAIQMKLLYFDFVRLVPPERQLELKNKMGQGFMEAEVPKMMATFEVASVEELDAKLRSYGSSLRKAQQLYIERYLGMVLLKQKIDDDPKVSHQELLDRYASKKQEEYFRPARVKYEELVVKVSRFPDKAAAFAELADMGNEVLRGAPFAAVAKRRSHGIGAASSGGQQDWTSRGSLVTQQVESVLFEIPLGKLSRIVEDGDAFYIVRAIDREEERYISFEEVQEDLREEIKKEKIAEAQDEYLASLFEKTHVWNKFEDEAVPSIAQREREIYEKETPLFRVGQRSGKQGESDQPSATPNDGGGSLDPTPDGGAYRPAPSDFQPGGGSYAPPGGEYQFR